MNFLTRTVRQGGGVGAPFAHIALGVAALAEADAEAAAATLGEVATWARTAGDTMSVLWAVPLLCQALVAAGRLDEAAAELEDAIRRAGPPIDNPWSSAQAQFGQGLLAIACGDTGEAENLLHQALAIQTGRGFVADGPSVADGRTDGTASPVSACWQAHSHPHLGCGTTPGGRSSS